MTPECFNFDHTLCVPFYIVATATEGPSPTPSARPALRTETYGSGTQGRLNGVEKSWIRRVDHVSLLWRGECLLTYS